jgi:hypothetical protein
MRIFLAIIVAAVVVIALVDLMPRRNDEITGKALAGCISQTEGLPLTALEKEAFVHHCMSYGHYSYSQQCGDARATKCYTPPGVLATKWFEIVDCMKFEEGSFEGSFKGCVRKFLRNAKSAAWG